MTNIARLSIAGLIACLTICQFTYARASETDVPSGSAAEEIDSLIGVEKTKVKRTKPAQVTGRMKTVLYPTPDSNEFILDFSLSGGSESVATSSTEAGRSIEAESEGSLFGTSFKGLYGLTDTFYVGGGASFSRYTTNIMIRDSAAVSQRETDFTREGFSDPKILAGAQHVWKNVRLLGELEGSISIKARETDLSKRDARYTEMTTSMTEGGHSLAPRLLAVADFFPLARAYFAAQYKFRFERTSDNTITELGFERFEQEITSGGNSTDLTLGFELPKWVNLGFATNFAFYEEAVSEVENAGGLFRQPTRVTPAPTFTGSLYGGYKLSRQILLVPSVAYQTVLSRSASSVQSDAGDIWMLQMSSKFAF